MANINVNNTITTNATKTSKAKSTSSKSTNSTSKSFDSYTNKKYTYSDIFKAASEKYNISQDLLEAVAYTESSFRANATSYCGAQGIMQLMPATAKSLGVTDAYDPVQNIMGGAKYLSQLLKKYNGNTSLALAAYNGGSGNVAKYNGVPSFCKSYVNKVENLIKKGVTVPNKTVTVSSLSKSGTLMSDYEDGNNISNTANIKNTSSKTINNKNNCKIQSTNKTSDNSDTNNSNTYNAYKVNKYRQFDQSQLTRIISEKEQTTVSENISELSEERIQYLLTKLGINANKSYDLVDILNSIKNYYV